MGWGNKLGLGVLALAPAAFLTVGAIDAFDAARFNMVAETAEAEVVRFVGGEYQSRTASKGNFGAYFPELRFTTNEGQEVVAISSSSRDSEFAQPMETGDILTARYDPGNVSDVRLWTPMQMFIGPGFFLFFGVFFGGMIGIAWVLFARK